MSGFCRVHIVFPALFADFEQGFFVPPFHCNDVGGE